MKILNSLSNKSCDNEDKATLLMAYLFNQSDYQIRLANDKGRLCMLFGSKRGIYNYKILAFTPENELVSHLSGIIAVDGD